LVLVGDIDQAYLLGLIAKVEKLIKRKIRFLIYTIDEYKNHSETEKKELLLIWES